MRGILGDIRSAKPYWAGPVPHRRLSGYGLDRSDWARIKVTFHTEVVCLVAERNGRLVCRNSPGDFAFAVEEPVLAPYAVECPTETFEVFLSESVSVSGGG